jgi:hypothetical protein
MIVIITVECLPFRIGHCSCPTILHKVDLKLRFIEGVAASGRLSIDLRILSRKFGTALHLILSQFSESCRIRSNLTELASAASVRSMLSCSCCKIASSTSLPVYSRYHNASRKVRDSSVNCDRTRAACWSWTEMASAGVRESLMKSCTRSSL